MDNRLCVCDLCGHSDMVEVFLETSQCQVCLGAYLTIHPDTFIPVPYHRVTEEEIGLEGNSRRSDEV